LLLVLSYECEGIQTKNYSCDEILGLGFYLKLLKVTPIALKVVNFAKEYQKYSYN
jgi:hypothetical protein